MKKKLIKQKELNTHSEKPFFFLSGCYTTRVNFWGIIICSQWKALLDYGWGGFLGISLHNGFTIVKFVYNFFSAQMNHADLQATFWVKSVSLHEAIYKLDLNNVWYNDLISHKLPL